MSGGQGAGERRRLLDLYCGGGGAAQGYADAGYDVTGVDNRPQKNYPFRFIQADAVEYCREHGAEYDFIHASPTCQRYSVTKSLHTNEYPDLIPATRAALRATGRPYVIENVVGAPLIEPVMLCGQMFGLPLYRHRLFECSFFLLAPPHPAHRFPATGRKGYGKQADTPIQTVTGSNYLAAKGRAAMGIDWLPMRTLNQAIPPAYTAFIGRAFLATHEAVTARSAPLASPAPRCRTNGADRGNRTVGGERTPQRGGE